MKYSQEIQAAVKAIEHDIAYFASGIRLQYPDKTFEEVKQAITCELRSKIADAPNREAGSELHDSSNAVSLKTSTSAIS